MLIDTIAIIVAILLALPLAVLGVECWLSLLPLRRQRLREKPATPFRIAVVIPAHDEADRIANAVTRIKEQVPDDTRVIVIADNCSDATAANAVGRRGRRLAAGRSGSPRQRLCAQFRLEAPGRFAAGCRRVHRRRLRTGPGLHRHDCPACVRASPAGSSRLHDVRPQRHERSGSRFRFGRVREERRATARSAMAAVAVPAHWLRHGLPLGSAGRGSSSRRSYRRRHAERAPILRSPASLRCRAWKSA